MLYADTINRLKQIAENAMTDTCTIRKESGSQDAYGAPTHNLEVVAVDVACRVIPAGENTSSRAGEAGSRELLEEIYQINLPAGTELGADYSVTVNNVNYIVVQVMQSVTDSVMTQALMVRDNG